MHPLNAERSLNYIERARKRIEYQKAAAVRLRLDRNEHSASLANEILASMEERLNFLLEQHGKLVANENAMEVSA